LKTLEPGFCADNLCEEEKNVLSEIIDNGWVSKNGGKITHNFSVFTETQERALLCIFGEIYDETEADIYRILEEIGALCRDDLPKHLDFYLNYHIYMAFYSSMTITTGFAYCDGKLYQPKDAVECGMLTFQAIVKDDTPLRVETLAVGGKDYKALYFGEQNMKGFKDLERRQYWRLENAYEDFKDNPKTGDVLPYNNYVMDIKPGQVFVIDYTKNDGTVRRRYYRSDGGTWQDMPTTEEFTAAV